MYGIIVTRKDVINLKKNIFNNLAKNKLFYTILIILAVSICATPPFALKQTYIGEDMLYHMLRIKELSNNILNGHLFPYIHANALDGYGYGGAFFYPELTLIIPALFYMIGFDILTSINISVIIYNAATGMIVYFCLNILLKDMLKKNKNIQWLALIGATAYIVYPYRLYDIFYRNAFNEFICMAFVPLAVTSMYKIFFKKEFKYWKMLSISFSLSLLTHLGVTLLLGILGSLFLVLNIRLLLNKEFIKSILKAIICSILATSYFLFPMIEQMASNEFFYTTLPKLNDIQIYANQTIDKKAITIVNGTLNQFTLILINSLIISTLLFIYKKLKNKVKDSKWVIITGSILVFVYVFIMQTDIFPWILIKEIFPVILKIQFPFRFFVLLGIPFSFIIALSAPALEDKNKFAKNMLILFIMISPNLMLSDNVIDEISIHKNDLNRVDTTWCLGYGEYLPSKIEPTYEKYLKQRGNVINIKYKDGTEENIERDSNESHTEYLFDNLKGNIESIELPLIYYKGYDIKNNEDNIEVKESSGGFVEIKNIPKDRINVNIYYKGTMVQDISNFITLIFLCSIIAFNKLYKR